MAGSTYGNIFKITTWGESHGKAVGVVVDGCPAGVPLCEEDIQFFLTEESRDSLHTLHSVTKMTRSRFCLVFLKEKLPALLFLWLYTIKIIILLITHRLQNATDRDTLITLLMKNMVSEIIAVADVHQVAKL